MYNIVFIVQAYSLLLISGIIGLLIGLNSMFREYVNLFFGQKNQSAAQQTALFSPTIDFDSCEFTETELRFLSYLIESKINNWQNSVEDLYAIIIPVSTGKQNDRLNRNNFIKSLNLKLFLIYGVKEGIVRMGLAEDKRRKYFIIDNDLINLGIASDIDRKANQLMLD
jgi:hypothetical protein